MERISELEPMERKSKPKRDETMSVREEERGRLSLREKVSTLTGSKPSKVH